MSFMRWIRNEEGRLIGIWVNDGAVAKSALKPQPPLIVASPQALHTAALTRSPNAPEIATRAKSRKIRRHPMTLAAASANPIKQRTNPGNAVN